MEDSSAQRTEVREPLMGTTPPSSNSPTTSTTTTSSSPFDSDADAGASTSMAILSTEKTSIPKSIVSKISSSIRAYHRDHPVMTYHSPQYHITLILTQFLRLVKQIVRGSPFWIEKFVRLVAYVLVLFPAWFVFVGFYLFGDRIVVPYNYSNNGNNNGNNDNNKHLNATITAEEEKNKKENHFRFTSRHFLDIYGSKQKQKQQQKKKPVLIFVTGGAWIIGYKMWGTLLARALLPFDVLLVMPDHRNFPQATMMEMAMDVDDAIQWTFDNCERFGGDKNRIVLVAQSAGAHLSSYIILKKLLHELTSSSQHSSSSSEEENSTKLKFRSTYNPRDLCGFIPVSGPFDLVKMQSYLHNRGFDRTLMSAICGKESVKDCSPIHILNQCWDILLKKQTQQKQQQQPSSSTSPSSTLLKENEVNGSLKDWLPPICVIHGTGDKTVPSEVGEQFANCLHDFGANVSIKLYHGWSHTDLILEGPMDGDHTFHRDVYNLIKDWTQTIRPKTKTIGTATTTEEEEKVTTTRPKDDDDDNDDDEEEEESKRDRKKKMMMMVPFDESLHACGRMCPRKLVEIARMLNPF